MQGKYYFCKKYNEFGMKGIKIRNYKSFRDEVNMELRPITVLIGRNSSGKSSLCKLVDAISVSLSNDAEGFLPLQTGHNRLGDRYEDLFYQRITNDLQIGVCFDGGKCIETTFLMQDGFFCPKSFTARNGEQVASKTFTSREESDKAGFVGLYLPQICDEVSVTSDDVQFSVDYIGPVRCRAQRRIERASVRKGNYVEDDGTRAYDMLLMSHLADGTLLRRVSDWFKANMDGQSLNISETSPGSGIFSLYVERGGAHVNIADVGEGLAQVLPVIVQSFVRNADVTIIEQPSLHLNSAAHALVACRLAASSVELGKKYIIETHSDTFLTGIRMMVAERKLDREDVVIYYVHHDGDSAMLDKIEIDDNYEYTSWPDGMFEDDYRLQNEIIRILG